MNNQDIGLAKILTYSGTLPLIFCTIALILKLPQIDASFIGRTYGAIIISFLSGIHWAVNLFYAEKCPRHLLITSNVIALTACLSLIATPQKMFILLQPLCFLFLLKLDLKLRDNGIIPDWFYQLRRNASIVVVLCLCVIIGLS